MAGRLAAVQYLNIHIHTLAQIGPSLMRKCQISHTTNAYKNIMAIMLMICIAEICGNKNEIHEIRVCEICFWSQRINFFFFCIWNIHMGKCRWHGIYIVFHLCFDDCLLKTNMSWLPQSNGHCGIIHSYSFEKQSNDIACIYTLYIYITQKHSVIFYFNRCLRLSSGPVCPSTLSFNFCHIFSLRLSCNVVYVIVIHINIIIIICNARSSS